MRLLMKSQNVLIAIFRLFDGRVQDHECYAEKQQTADEKKDDHGVTKIGDDRRRDLTASFRFREFFAGQESIGAGNEPSFSKRGNFEAHCENIGVELKSCLPEGKPARRWRGNYRRVGVTKGAGKLRSVSSRKNVP
jgi:hypothetical protein